MTDWLKRAALAELLDGYGEAPDLYPFPDTTLARIMERAVEAMKREVDDPRQVEIAERLVSRLQEKAKGEQFQ